MSLVNTPSHHILDGKRGIIFGVLDEQSLAWSVAHACVEEGAKIVLTNTSQAIALGKTEELGARLEAPVIPCDATDTEQIAALLDQATDFLGGKIDFILHSVAMSQNLRRHRDYDNLNYTYFHTTLDVSALSLHKLLQTCIKKDALASGGSVVTLSYIAADRHLSLYGDMSDAKALLESIVRNMGAVYAQKKGIRVNAVSQSPVPTRAEQQYREVDYFHTYTEQLSPLGLATAEDCGKLCVMLFSDYTRSITMQTIYNDGGFSQTLMTPHFIEFFRKGMESIEKDRITRLPEKDEN